MYAVIGGCWDHREGGILMSPAHLLHLLQTLPPDDLRYFIVHAVHLVVAPYCVRSKGRSLCVSSTDSVSASEGIRFV